MDSKSKAKKELDILINQIQDHSYRYYVENDPDISDSEFDELYKQLVNIESQYHELINTESSTQRVGAETRKAFKQVNQQKQRL